MSIEKFKVGDAVILNGLIHWGIDHGVNADVINTDHTGDVQVMYDSDISGPRVIWVDRRDAYMVLLRINKPKSEPPEFDMKKYCTHIWKPTTLIMTVVYDCTHCGMKKEDL